MKNQTFLPEYTICQISAEFLGDRILNNLPCVRQVWCREPANFCLIKLQVNDSLWMKSVHFQHLWVLTYPLSAWPCLAVSSQYFSIKSVLLASMLSHITGNYAAEDNPLICPSQRLSCLLCKDSCPRVKSQ